MANVGSKILYFVYMTFIQVVLDF